MKQNTNFVLLDAQGGHYSVKLQNNAKIVEGILFLRRAKKETEISGAFNFKCEVYIGTHHLGSIYADTSGYYFYDEHGLTAEDKIGLNDWMEFKTNTIKKHARVWMIKFLCSGITKESEEANRIETIEFTILKYNYPANWIYQDLTQSAKNRWRFRHAIQVVA